MRAVWTGSIGFGLVSIPVRLYPAVSPKDPRFHLLDRKTGRRIQNRRVVRDRYEPPQDDEPEDPGPSSEAESEASSPPMEEPAAAEVPSFPSEPSGDRRAQPAAVEREVAGDELVRGFEVERGRHVVLEAEEIEALRPEQTRTIEIEHFVELAEIDPVYFEKSYHVAPADEIGEKPYHLLRRAMEEEGQVAIGRFVMRTREHLVAVRPTQGILGLETLYVADEVRAPATRWTGDTSSLRKPELQMAKRLIETMREPWDPTRYGDPFRERIMELIRQREGDAVSEIEEEEAAPAAAVPDLMAALKASVEQLSRGKPRKRSGSAG